MRGSVWIPVALGVLLLSPTIRHTGAQTKTIPVGIKVEAEGGGQSQGMWAQSAKDLSAAEVEHLDAMVRAEIKDQEGITTVPLDYKDDYISLVVVAAKLPNGNANWYVASSVINLAEKGGSDDFVTHDVIAASDLPSLARNIAFQFASVRFRIASGLTK